MITENPQRRPASAEMAAGWLHRVQQLLGEYTGFTSQFAEALQQTVTRGLPFPDPSWYAESTRILGQQRTVLLDEIRMSAWMPDSAGWDLPAGDAPLVHFAESLADLQQVSCELQRQQDELLPRYLDVSATAAQADIAGRRRDATHRTTSPSGKEAAAPVRTAAMAGG